MKTKLTLLFLVIALTCSAQKFKFVSDNPKDMRPIADSIALNAKRTFKFSIEKPVQGMLMTKILYTNISDPKDIIYILYSMEIVGENKALEIKGTPVYTFRSATGKFLDLFPFWKKFINPNLNIVTASDQTNEAIVDGKRLIFRDEPNISKWEISIH